MSYEKKYNEALKRAKKFKEHLLKINDEGYAYEIDCMFPELAESEDEKKINNLIDELKCSLKAANCQNDACGGGHEKRIALLEWGIAWLEKQGDTNETINRDEFAQGVLRRVAINLITWIDYNAAEGSMCLSNMECKDVEDALVSGDWNKIYAYIKKKVEKQGEKKPQGKSALEAIKEEKVDNQNCVKSTDKVEPKFDVDDWVVTDKGETVQIVAVNNGNYTLYNRMKFDIFYVDKFWHKWTIADAKAGDVLTSLDKSDILIFRNLDASETFSSYYNTVGKGNLCWANDCFIPATKVQRDLLFKKMHEAGYEWDEGKLELKKIASDNAEQDRLPFIWHDAAKELPPKHDDDYSEEVLVHTLSGSRFMLKYNYSINRWTNSFRITHWAYLPEPPKT